MDQQTDLASTHQPQELPSQTAANMPGIADLDKYTIAWLSDTQVAYTAAQLFLKEQHDVMGSAELSNHLQTTFGRIANHNVVIACIPSGNAGIAGMAIAAATLKHSFRNMKAILVVGSAGGGAPSRYHGIRLGDVVVGSSVSHTSRGGVLQFDGGKTVQGEPLQSTPGLKEPPPFLRLAVANLKSRHDRYGLQYLQHSISEVLEQIKRNPSLTETYRWPGSEYDIRFRSEVPYERHFAIMTANDLDDRLIWPQPERSADHGPVIHYGIIASASQAMRDPYLRDELSEREDISCFDVGSSGVVAYFPGLVIRGIQDYSDSYAHHRWRGWSALTAAAYAAELLRYIPNEAPSPAVSIPNMLQSPGVLASGISRDPTPDLRQRYLPQQARETPAGFSEPVELASHPSPAMLSPSTHGGHPGPYHPQQHVDTTPGALPAHWQPPIDAAPSAAFVAYPQPNDTRRGGALNSIRMYAFHQKVLVVTFAIFSALVGAMAAKSLMQVRESNCNPKPQALSGDDGFWALLCQLFLQILASYCTTYAVLNNKDVEGSVEGYWFWSSLAVSLTTSIAAIIVYGWSWQVSTGLSIFSGFVQLIPAGQLAMSLGSDNVKTKMERRRTFKMEEGHTD
ncbi:nucleoside phosphorylase domain-containing protein [Plectosphaerella cucumerina]|uniref:Nucleoside phosphorylase domain-containing protein n=1 Tax=Plectosphaerella cucumerina TaxID=40658 RepID=A0A8K0TBZ7_9PEZI|nr:nucleoside phosphorylase domain-containing protein [Plectosphaerella cucumerina]